jgi:hypothetical protein
LSLGLVAACSGGKVSLGDDGPDAEAFDGATPDAAGVDGATPPHDSGTLDAHDSAVGAEAAPPPRCPIKEPTIGENCSPVSLQCEYGGNISTACDAIFLCTATGWSTAPAATPLTPCSHGSCPSAYPATSVGTTCDPTGLVCSYPDGTCTCVTPIGPGVSGEVKCSGSTGPCWQCYPSTSGCPSPRPQIGTQCTDFGKMCDYAACAGGVELECEDGTWKEVPIPCPT